MTTNEYRISFGSDENRLKFSSGDGHTTLNILRSTELCCLFFYLKRDFVLLLRLIWNCWAQVILPPQLQSNWDFRRASPSLALNCIFSKGEFYTE